MTLYYLKQDDTIPGCGDPGCCGAYYEEIGESFVDCIHKVEVDADHLHGCNGGGPVLEWRKATPLEVIAYESGIDNSYSDGYNAGWDFGIKDTEERIFKVLNSQRDTGSHDAENDFINGLLDELSALIKGEK